MNVLIKNLSNTFNYGSMMMGENLISYFNKFSKKDISYFVETNNDIHIERLKRATGYEKIYINDIHIQESKSTNKIIRKINNIFAKKELYNRYKQKYDYIFVLGGDDYSEEYYDIKTEGRYIIQMLRDLVHLNKKVPVYMLGQTIGPYTGIRKTVASRVFNKIKLYTRDEKNYEYLTKELNCSPFKMHDLAFLNLNYQANMNGEILKKYNLKKNNYIVLVGTGLIRHYTNNEMEFLAKYTEVIKFIKKKNPRKKLVWLSHVVGTQSADTKMLKALLEKYPDIQKQLTVIDVELLPVEAREILGNAYFNCSCRMHAAVSTYQMGKPCICLSYSPKYSGVIGKEFNMPDFVIECKGNQFWQNDNKIVLNKLENAINKINSKYDKICSKIDSRVKKIKLENEKIIKNIVVEMEK